MRATSRLVLLLLRGESGCFAQLCAVLLLQPAECMLWAGAAAEAVRCQLDACCGFLHEDCMAGAKAACWMLQQGQVEAVCFCLL